jgi:hypothetical protein
MFAVEWKPRSADTTCGTSEVLLVSCDRRLDERGVVDINDGDVGDDTAFGLLHLDRAPELGGLVLVALADDLRVRPRRC